MKKTYIKPSSATTSFSSQERILENNVVSNGGKTSPNPVDGPPEAPGRKLYV